MSQKFPWWSIIIVGVFAVGVFMTGCSKKYVVKEEAAARPAPVVEAKKEAPPVPVAPPKVEEAKPPVPTPAPAPAPKAEIAPPAPAAPEPIDLSALRVQFAFDDYSLSTRSKQNLKKLGDWMKKNESAKIQVEGHTCDLGTSEYNLALSERRALVAKKHLENLGIASNRVSVIGYGEEKPLVPNTNEANRSKNRRDEFVMAK
jgi:peptidoglycan-associated lipoprotein